MASNIPDEEALKLFSALQLNENSAKELCKSQKNKAALVDVINEAHIQNGCSKPQGALFQQVALKFPISALRNRPTLLEYIKEDKIKSNTQLDHALAYMKKTGPENIDISSFEKECGVGLEITPAQIKEAVHEVINQHKDIILEERYQYNTKLLIPKVRNTGDLKWGDVTLIQKILEEQIQDLLGPKTKKDIELEKQPKSKKKPIKPEKQKEKEPQAVDPVQAKEQQIESLQNSNPFAFLPKPEENYNTHTTIHFSDGKIMHVQNTKEQLERHLKETGGRILTRFPPEPNGYLHIGHAKALFIDFGLPQQYGGGTYLRFDDTNPEAEKQEYIDHIQDIVSWLGWKPFKITHSADYFDQLYELAVKLIKVGCAYVDHQTGDEIHLYRQNKEGSPWRDRPIEESLREFENMKKGLWDENKATLRMKQDPKNEQTTFFDLIAYRVKFIEHPKAGDKWCIYPSYDYTHCIVDSLENITHSMPSLEFETRRGSYFWLLEVLDLYKPFVWEFSRLKLTNNVLSKRKLNVLATQGYVKGWDDPRLLTLAGIRRRGVPPLALNNFCRDTGVTRADQLFPLHKLDYHIRQVLDLTSPRCMAVLDPVEVTITNVPDDFYEEVDAKLFPNRSEESYKMPLTKIVYVEREDVRTEDSKTYFGLAPGKQVMLRYGFVLTCKDVQLDSNGEINKAICEIDKGYKGKPPKGVLHWVGQPKPGKRPVALEARLYSELFKSENPSDLGDEWLADLNPNSLQLLPNALGGERLKQAKVGDVFQFERLGYFCVDPDTTEDKIVFNRAVTLKESVKKIEAFKK